MSIEMQQVSRLQGRSGEEEWEKKQKQYLAGHHIPAPPGLRGPAEEVEGGRQAPFIAVDG